MYAHMANKLRSDDANSSEEIRNVGSPLDAIGVATVVGEMGVLAQVAQEAGGALNRMRTIFLIEPRDSMIACNLYPVSTKRPCALKE